MPGATWALERSSPVVAGAPTARHAAIVRITHWITFICFLGLLVSGIEMIFPHPRFYWGENGTVLTPPLFSFPIPSSRAMVPTGYGYVLADQNGWSRALHFQSAWLLVFTGIVYLAWAFVSGHVRRTLVPARGDRRLAALSRVVSDHLRRKPTAVEDASSYNPLQRIAYLGVLFVLFPLIIWTGLAMSPAFTGALPATVTLLGGRQTARTLHLFVSIAIVVFFLIHVALVWRAGFTARVAAMITGRASDRREAS